MFFLNSISLIMYERLKEIEEPTNNIEHKEIYEIVQNKINTSKSDYVSLDDMAKKFIFLDLKSYNISQ